MNTQDARFTPAGQALLKQRVLNIGWTMVAVAQGMGVSRRKAFKQLGRIMTQGAPGT